MDGLVLAEAHRILVHLRDKCINWGPVGGTQMAASWSHYLASVESFFLIYLLDPNRTTTESFQIWEPTLSPFKTLVKKEDSLPQKFLSFGHSLSLIL